MKKQLIAVLSTLVLSICLTVPMAAQDSAQPGRPDVGPRAPVQVPAPPAEISAEEVEKEVATLREHGRHDQADLNRIAEWLDTARTSRGAGQIMAMAMAALHERGIGPREPDAQALFRTYNAAGMDVRPSFTSGHGQGGACVIDFDNPAVLNTFFDKAQATFSSPPHWQEYCGSAQVSVEPTVYNHYHLLYEDATIDCIDSNTGHFGRGEPGNCVALADPAQEPRYLGTHHGSEVLHIRLTNGGVIEPFTMHSFVNAGDTPVKFRYQTLGGQWFQWNSMGGNQAWDVSAYVVDAIEVQITNADTSLACGPDWEAGGPGGCPFGAAPIFLDDFVITP